MLLLPTQKAVLFYNTKFHDVVKQDDDLDRKLSRSTTHECVHKVERLLFVTALVTCTEPQFPRPPTREVALIRNSYNVINE